MIRLALTDLDDTLIPYGQGRASDAAIAALRAANAAPDVVAGPVSGRSIPMMDWMFGQEAADCFATGVFSNGQVVRLGGRELVHHAPSRETLDELARYLREREGESVALTVYDDVDGREFCIGVTLEEMARHPKAYHAFHLAAPCLPEGEFVKTNIHADRPRAHMEELRRELEERFSDLAFVFPSATSSTIDITPAGVSKRTGVECLMEALGVSADEVCVFGDSENDLSALEAVPNSVAVANAMPKVAKAARWHIGPASEDAVASALLDIAEAAKSGAMPAFMRG